MKTAKSNMCKALEGLIEDGRKEEIEALFRLINEGIITCKQAAKSLDISEKSFIKQLSDYGYLV